jgi:phage gp36-like protein
MPYCTLTDIKKELPEAKIIDLTDDANAGVVYTDYVTEAIKKADAKIDTFVGNRFSVPLSPVPNVVNALSVALSIYFLYKRRGNIPDSIQKQYEADEKLLIMIAKGTVGLGTTVEPTESANSDAAEGATDEDDRTFTKDTLSNF